MLSFIGHFFCFAFFTFSYDYGVLKSEDNLSVAFLGSILNQSELVIGKITRPFAGHIPFKKLSFPKRNNPESFDKPKVISRNVSGAKRLNKFLVLGEGAAYGGKAPEKNGYLASPPAWEKVDLKLKIE